MDTSHKSAVILLFHLALIQHPHQGVILCAELWLLSLQELDFCLVKQHGRTTDAKLQKKEVPNPLCPAWDRDLCNPPYKFPNTICMGSSTASTPAAWSLVKGLKKSFPSYLGSTVGNSSLGQVVLRCSINAVKHPLLQASTAHHRRAEFGWAMGSHWGSSKLQEYKSHHEMWP